MSDKAIEVIADCLEVVDGADYTAVGRAILAELKSAGFAVVELPAAQPSGIIGQTEWPVESRYMPAVVTIRYDGLIADSGVSNPYASPSDARSHAAALLAAADAADAAERAE